MKRFLHHALALAINSGEGWLIRRPRLYRLLLADQLGPLRVRVGAWRAWVAFQRAYRTVPAYRDYVDRHGGKPRLRCRDGAPDLTAIPQTDKDSYVRRYPNEARCVGGKLPVRGVVVDESSGSSGTPTSWVRGPRERFVTKQMLQMSYRAALGESPSFVINAFALGAWATGLNVTLGLNDICVMKSTGPDIDKIVHTMREFGPGYDYVVMGYPPFLKTLADSRELDWEQYRVRAVFGGEAMSESMRAYLLRTFTEVVGSYGASDLEINMAAESPFTIRLRREIEANDALRRRLTRPDSGVTPMVFQYNPLAYHLETNRAGELVVTLARPWNVAPKIRYNIHDLGHVAAFEDVAAVLAEEGAGDVVAETAPPRLPVLFLYGRSDLSVDYYGANVTPDSVREILFSFDDLAPHLNSFRLITREDDRHDKTLEVAVELAGGADPAAFDPGWIAERLFDRLARVNADFANAYRNTATADQLPEVVLYTAGSGPFSGARGIKHDYVAAAG